VESRGAKVKAVSLALQKRAAKVVAEHPAGIKSWEVATICDVGADHARRALALCAASGIVVLIGRGPSSRWATPEHADAVRAAVVRKAREQEKETARRARRTYKERKAMRMAQRDESDDDAGHFTHIHRPQGTWERSNTDQLAPATWLCAAFG
jgi:uncharacterized protein